MNKVNNTYTNGVIQKLWMKIFFLSNQIILFSNRYMKKDNFEKCITI